MGRYVIKKNKKNKKSSIASYSTICKTALYDKYRTTILRLLPNFISEFLGDAFDELGFQHLPIRLFMIVGTIVGFRKPMCRAMTNAASAGHIRKEKFMFACSAAFLGFRGTCRARRGCHRLCRNRRLECIKIHEKLE